MLRQGATLVAIGAVVGLAAAVSLARVFERLLFNVRAVDVSSGLAVIVLMSVALLACVVPAVRATRVDPALALRNE